MATLLPNVRQQFLDANGAPLSGGKLFSYAAGTTTPQSTYTDAGAGTPNNNPLILDANGMGDVWISALAYKFVLKDSSDVTLWTVDNVSHISDLAVTTAKINALAVTTAKINDAAVTTAKINDSAVTTAKINDGAVTTSKLGAASVTKAKLAALGQQTGSKSVSSVINSTSRADVANLTTSITTTGRPVFICVFGGDIDGPGIHFDSSGLKIAIMRDSTDIVDTDYSNAALSGSDIFGQALSLVAIDTPSSGTYTYKVQAALLTGGGTATVSGNTKLVVFEL